MLVRGEEQAVVDLVVADDLTLVNAADQFVPSAGPKSKTFAKLLIFIRNGKIEDKCF